MLNRRFRHIVNTALTTSRGKMMRGIASRIAMMMRVFAPLGALIFFTQCSPVDAVNALTSTKSIQSIETFAYAAGARGSLDVYTPKDPLESAPVVVFIYGGGWDSGAKEDYKFAAEAFTSAGYTVVVPDYRLYPDVIYPAFVEDAASAVAWTAQRYAGRPIVLIGHSAGAYSALMLALETDFLTKQGVDRCDMIAGAIGLSGPYGAVELTREPHISIFPERFTSDDAPINRASNAVPPILLVTGLKDKRVYPTNSIKLASTLEHAGAAVSLITYPELDHVDTAKLLSHFFANDAPLRKDLLDFIKVQSDVTAPFCGS